MNYLSVPYGLRISVEKRFFMMRANLLHRIPRSFIQVSPIDHLPQQISRDLDIRTMSSPGLMTCEDDTIEGILAGYHFFSEPGPINDHCPIPNLPANVFTMLAFLRHSSLLSYLSQKMSLNIDINRILPVKDSGVCPKELRRLLILSQSCNDVNLGKIFHSNYVNSPLTSSQSL